MSQESKDYPVLIVDDDEIILVALNETISIEGYRIVQTTSPLQALEYIRKEVFAVIVSDQRMAEMTGLEFLAEAKKIQPDASRILITGVLTLKTVIDAVNKGEIFRFLAKPWIREELIATVKNAYQRFQLIALNHKLKEDTLKLNERLAKANAELQDRLRELRENENKLEATNEALRKNFDHSLELCDRIISVYYPLLGEETRAIVNLCDRMIETGPISAEDAYVLRTAAWLQNIGLIGISRELLSKARKNPDQLSGNERRLIRNHPIYGQTLAAFVDALETVGTTIRAHHERWDGEGYPDGLAREAIPKPARMLAVAVHFLECSLNKEEAVDDILRKSGSAFDPEAVRLFMKATRLVTLPRKYKEVLLSELSPEMVLAKGIFSPTGLLLIPEGHVLTEKMVDKIRDHNMVDPINQCLLIYR